FVGAQEVAAIARLHVDFVAEAAQTANFFQQNDLHRLTLFSDSPAVPVSVFQFDVRGLRRARIFTKLPTTASSSRMNLAQPISSSARYTPTSAPRPHCIRPTTPWTSARPAMPSGTVKIKAQKA